MPQKYLNEVYHNSTKNLLQNMQMLYNFGVHMYECVRDQLPVYFMSIVYPKNYIQCHFDYKIRFQLNL